MTTRIILLSLYLLPLLPPTAWIVGPGELVVRSLSVSIINAHLRFLARLRGDCRVTRRAGFASRCG